MRVAGQCRPRVDAWSASPEATATDCTGRPCVCAWAKDRWVRRAFEFGDPLPRRSQLGIELGDSLVRPFEVASQMTDSVVILDRARGDSAVGLLQGSDESDQCLGGERDA